MRASELRSRAPLFLPPLSVACFLLYPAHHHLSLSLSISRSRSPVAVGHNSLDFSEEIRCRAVERVTSEMATEGKKLYTLSDVAVHNSSNDCWLIIGGKVKDPCPLWSSVFSFCLPRFRLLLSLGMLCFIGDFVFYSGNK